MKIELFTIFALLLLPQAVYAVEPSIYISMNPDTTLCLTERFGDYGHGEYYMTMDDPGFPDSPWVDTHSVRFLTGYDNPITIPICFNSYGRAIGDRATITLELESPQENITFIYGICVSEHEDVDYIVDNIDPCVATIQNTDFFSMDILEPEYYAAPGERVKYTLLLSSGFPLTLNLNKDSGPAMDIETTIVAMPGERMIELWMDSPMDEGDYEFTLTARIEGCSNSPSCSKSITKTHHVTSTTYGTFDISLAPVNKDVVGILPVKFYITVTNNGAAGEFIATLDVDESLRTATETMTMIIGKESVSTANFVVTPIDSSHIIHKVKVVVEGPGGEKRMAESTLTVGEAASDARRGAENGNTTDEEAQAIEDALNDGTLDTWNFMDSDDDFNIIDNTAEGETPGINWIVIVIAVIVIGAVGFLVYKKSVVSNEYDAPFSS